MLINQALTLAEEMDQLGEPQMRASKRRPRNLGEAAHHIAIVKWLAVTGAAFNHSPNEGKRSARFWLWLRSLGTRKGWPDLEVFHNGRCVFLEIKQKGERLTDDQERCHAHLRRAGFQVYLVHDLDEARGACREAGLLP